MEERISIYITLTSIRLPVNDAMCPTGNSVHQRIRWVDAPRSGSKPMPKKMLALSG